MADNEQYIINIEGKPVEVTPEVPLFSERQLVKPLLRIEIRRVYWKGEPAKTVV